MVMITSYSNKYHTKNGNSVINYFTKVNSKIFMARIRRFENVPVAKLITQTFRILLLP